MPATTPFSTAGMYWFGTTPPLTSSSELEALAARQRLEPQVHLAELAAPAGLLLVPVLALRLALDGLAVGHVRLGQHHLDAEALLQAVDHDLELQVAHAVHQRLLGAGLVVAAERRVLLVQARERPAPSSPRRPCSWRGCTPRSPAPGSRRRELHRPRLVGQRVAGVRLLELDRGDDVAGRRTFLQSRRSLPTRW